MSATTAVHPTADADAVVLEFGEQVIVTVRISAGAAITLREQLHAALCSIADQQAAKAAVQQAHRLASMSATHRER